MILNLFLFLGSQAFAYINSLVCVYWMGIVISFPTDIFLGSSHAVPCSATYTLPSCSQINGPLIIPSLVVSIEKEVYYECSNIMSVFISSTITSIGYNIIIKLVYKYNNPNNHIISWN